MLMSVMLTSSRLHAPGRRSKRLLLVVERNYVDRADAMPDSGVGKEIRAACRSLGHLDVSPVRPHPDLTLPAWTGGSMPKGFDFNHSSNSLEQFPAADQIENLWRWISALPANRDNATAIATLRERATRLEHHRAPFPRCPRGCHYSGTAL